MNANSRWFNDPQFLTQRENSWPVDPTLRHKELTDEDAEVKHDLQHCCLALTNHVFDVFSKLIHRFSSWEKLRNVTAWLLRFKPWFIVKYPKSRAIPSATTTGALSDQEVKTAEKEIFKHVQRDSFSDVLKILQRLDQSQSPRQMTSELKNLKTPKSMRKHHPVSDNDGILRVERRLENAAVEYETKHPIILPYRHHVTDLIILHHHHRAGHLSQEYVLASLRQLYWIIKGRSQSPAESSVHRVIGDCFICKKLGALLCGGLSISEEKRK